MSQYPRVRGLLLQTRQSFDKISAEVKQNEHSGEISTGRSERPSPKNDSIGIKGGNDAR